jgi:hypothetical protein
MSKDQEEANQYVAYIQRFKQLTVHSKPGTGLDSYILWVEERIQFLLELSNEVKTHFEDNVSYEVTLELLHAFQNYFKIELKPLLNRLSYDWRNIQEAEKLTKYIDLLKNPFDEMAVYPEQHQLPVEKLGEWYASLVEALEHSTQKLMRFLNHMNVPSKT